MKINTLQRGLVAHWTLDNITGAVDKTPNNNNGTAQGGITIGTATDRFGIANRATTFDGTDDYINCGNNSSLLGITTFTLSAWIKTTNTSIASRIFSNRTSSDGYEFAIFNDGSLVFISNGTVQATYGTGLNNGNWHLITATFDSGTLKLYIEGTNVSTTNSVTINTIVNNLYIGQSYGTANRFFNGSMSDARVYNRALSQDEITQLYNEYRPKLAMSSLQRGLVGRWKLDAIHGATDLTPNNLNGIANGGLVIGDTTDQHGQANRATSYDDTNKYISCGVPNLQNTEFSISFWAIGPSTLSGQHHAISMSGSDFRMGRNGSALYIYSTDGNLTISSSLLGATWDNWHLYTLTYKENEAIAYRDDVVVGTDTTCNLLPDEITSFLIGKLSTYYWNGSLSDVRVWNRALSATEVLQLSQEYL